MFELEIKIGALIPTLKDHPQVGPRLNGGLGGNTFIDHVIGLVEEGRDSFPQDAVLKACYLTLQREYPIYFSARRITELEPENHAYKAQNRF